VNINSDENTNFRTLHLPITPCPSPTSFRAWYLTHPIDVKTFTEPDPDQIPDPPETLRPIPSTRRPRLIDRTAGAAANLPTAVTTAATTNMQQQQM
jgi:hypothetical protein